jgi:NDP-sugar pyrophosphorylase family protein
MKHLLICPSERPAVSALSRHQTLAAVPLFGHSLLEYWLSSLALAGQKEITILAHDRPEQVHKVVADGSRWGLQVKLIQESRELSPAQALLKYAGELDGPTQSAITLLDHFPAMQHRPLFNSYRELFSGMQVWMPNARTPERVGVNEIKPGVWIGSHSAVSPKANLRGPCWIGQHVYIGAGAVIGPNAAIEDGGFIEAGAEIADSCVGSHTYVGKLARLSGSFACGSTLVDWRSDSLTEVPDPFLLCALRQQGESVAARWFARLSELYAKNKEEAGLLWKHLLLNKEG